MWDPCLRIRTLPPKNMYIFVFFACPGDGLMAPATCREVFSFDAASVSDPVQVRASHHSQSDRPDLRSMQRKAKTIISIRIVTSDTMIAPKIR